MSFYKFLNLLTNFMERKGANENLVEASDFRLLWLTSDFQITVMFIFSIPTVEPLT